MDYIYFKSFEMWFWRRKKKIIWAYHVKSKEVLQSVKEERNIVYKIKGRTASWIGHILHRICLLKYFVEGKIEGPERRRRRRQQLLNYLKEKKGYWKLKEESLDRTLWRTRFGRGYEPVVRRRLRVEDDYGRRSL